MGLSGYNLSCVMFISSFEVIFVQYAGRSQFCSWKNVSVAG